MLFYITGTHKGGLGEYLSEIVPVTETLEECDVFINCKHDGFDQVEMLYKAVEMKKKVISIGSYASDFTTHPEKPWFRYSIEKRALRDASGALYDHGYDTTCLNFGYIDTERTAHLNEKKMSKEYICDIIFWVLRQPHRVKELTITA